MELYASLAHLNNKIEESLSKTECIQKRQRFKKFFFLLTLNQMLFSEKNTDLLCWGPWQQTQAKALLAAPRLSRDPTRPSLLWGVTTTLVSITK